MFYTIETVATGWAVSYGKHWLATFSTHAEARAFIYGRRTAAQTG